MKKQYMETENKNKDKREEFHFLNNDNYVFVPVQHIRSIERVINNLKEIQKRLVVNEKENQ